MSVVEPKPVEGKTASQRAIEILRKVLMTGSITWLLVCVMLVFLETSMIYPAPRHPIGNWSPDFAHEDVDFESSDGTRLHGWLMRSEQTTKRHFLVCHGNGEHVAYCASYLGQRLRDHFQGNVFIFDYRGYGKSEGTPGEAGIKLDGDRAMEVFCEKVGVKPEDVIVVGSSLGGGVATHIASTKGCKALVLQRTFDSMVNVAADKYPIFPIRLLLQNRYESFDALKKYNGPVFQSHGKSDRIVPLKNGEALFKATSHPKSKFTVLPGIGHNDPPPASYWESLSQWLDELDSEETKEGEAQQ